MRYKTEMTISEFCDLIRNAAAPKTSMKSTKAVKAKPAGVMKSMLKKPAAARTQYTGSNEDKIAKFIDEFVETERRMEGLLKNSPNDMSSRVYHKTKTFFSKYGVFTAERFQEVKDTIKQRL